MNLNLKVPKKQSGFIQFVGAAFGAASMFAGNKARKAQNKARRAQQQANRIRNFQAQRDFLRNFQQQQAVALAQPIAAGVDVTSSAAQATRASQRSQAGVASLDFSTLSDLGEQASAQLNRAARASFASDVFSTVGQFASSDAGQSLLDKYLG